MHVILSYKQCAEYFMCNEAEQALHDRKNEGEVGFFISFPPHPPNFTSSHPGIWT